MSGLRRDVAISFLRPLSGGEPARLVSFENLSPSGLDRVEFAADDSHFYFTLSERESDIKMMELLEIVRTYAGSSNAGPAVRRRGLRGTGLQ
jgi:hypothetical protein